MPIVFTALCLVGLVITLAASARGSDVGRYAAKPLASLAFILVAATGGALAAGTPSYSHWIFVGLILGAVGDVALMLSGRRWFLVGLVAFLLGHVAYIVAFHRVTPVSTWGQFHTLVPFAVAVPVLVWLWPHLGAMRWPVIAYVIVISSMVVGALAILSDPEQDVLSAARVWLACAGAAFFFVSDLAVARQRFVRESLSNRLWGLPAYYVAQLLLAWSAFPAGN